MTKVKNRYFKNCSGCGAEQSYGRLDHYKSSIKGDWKCKSCANFTNNFKGKLESMPYTWFEMKRKSGISRGLDWDLEPKDIIELYNNQNKKCALTNWDIGWEDKGLTATISIDRIDSSKGYIKENIQLLHKDVNMAKQQYSQKYFIDMCLAVSKNNKEKQIINNDEGEKLCLEVY